eukprot:Phypoly_transcript_09660.p1 GENE.Phypoly_transcript_09660~~Phypoly_transcript_09660.p1  ORF type:complete len:446 (+),score=48.87 Phypoly_transcript_09660:34-1338(+)
MALLLVVLALFIASTFASFDISFEISPSAANCSITCSTGTFCCEDTCCNSGIESCCPDKQHGSICCMAESTYCCAPVGDYASHCCPRWNICCNGGRYGCCDPATGKPTEDNYAYALFVLQKDFAALKIDLSSGSYTQIPVTGYNDWSEITRVFTYDPVHNLFYLVQTNFLSNPQAPAHNITLYTIDPTTGSTVAKTIQGCTEPGQVDVPGFVYNPATNQIVMSTYSFENNMIGYKFYILDPETAVATFKSQYYSANDSYAGWFSVVTPDNNYVYRVGYQDVVNQMGSGLGETCISATTATTKFYIDIPVPPKHQFYLSLSLFGDYMLSLAPDELGNLNLVQWNIQGQASIIANYSDAHNTPFFGPIVEFINPNQSTYAALIVQNKIISDADRWTIVLNSLQSSKGGITATPREIPLSPILLAKLESASAFGIPN